MSKHIISISSEYTTSNGRRGVCYTLRGARAASFVPADVDALGWLLASLGLAKKEEKMTWTVELEKHRKHKSWMASCGLKSNGRYLAFDFLRCSWKGGEKVYDVTEHGVYATQERNTRRHWIYEGGEAAREVTEEEAIAHLQAATDAKDVMGELRALAEKGRFAQARARIDALPRDEARPYKRWLLDTIDPELGKGLPALEGTEKQIAWAEDIRVEQLLRCAILATQGGGLQGLDVAAMELVALGLLVKEVVSAKTWIDTRDFVSVQVWAKSLDLTEEQIERIETQLGETYLDRSLESHKDVKFWRAQVAAGELDPARAERLIARLRERLENG